MLCTCVTTRYLLYALSTHQLVSDDQSFVHTALTKLPVVATSPLTGINNRSDATLMISAIFRLSVDNAVPCLRAGQKRMTRIRW